LEAVCGVAFELVALDARPNVILAAKTVDVAATCSGSPSYVGHPPR
jgi:hypothetical protein